jgi:predicted ABC-type ATPase
VPEETLRRRYAAGWRNFLGLYRPIADERQVHDNSLAEETLVARAYADGRAEVVAPALWDIIEAGPQEP